MYLMCQSYYFNLLKADKRQFTSGEICITWTLSSIHFCQNLVSLHAFQWFLIRRKKWKTVWWTFTSVQQIMLIFLFKLHEHSFCASPLYAGWETDLFQQNHHRVQKPPFKAETPAEYGGWKEPKWKKIYTIK